MAVLIYVLCAITASICAVMLLLGSRRTGSSIPIHCSSSCGQAIQVAACGCHSPGMAKPRAPGERAAVTVR